MKWLAKGYVTAIHRKTFWSRLWIMRRPREAVDANIALSTLSARERSLLQIGAYFTILKGGSIRFSRMRWTKTEIDRASKAAQKLWLELFRHDCTDEGEPD